MLVDRILRIDEIRFFMLRAFCAIKDIKTEPKRDYIIAEKNILN